MTDVSSVPDRVDDASPRRRRWPVVAAVVVVLLIWGVAACLTAGRAALDLREARGLFVAAEGQLRDADLSGATGDLRAGVELAESSSERLHAAHLVPLRAVPVVAANLRAATALSDAARDSGGAAVELLDAATTIVQGDGQMERGEISLDYLTKLAPALRQLSSALDRTTEEVEAAGGDVLVGPLQRARATYLDLAVPAREQVSVAADLAEVMPQFLGQDGPRTYLLAAASLSELRASGGLLGSFTTLTADEGRLEFDDFIDIDLLGSAPSDVSAPSEEFADRYAELDGLRQWKNVNFTPDFPSSAEVMSELWDASGREPIDGVIAVDAITFEKLVERSGSLQVGDMATLTEDDTAEYVGLEAYAAFDDSDARHRMLGAVATSAFTRMLDVLEDEDVPATAEMLWELAEGGHLRVYSSDSTVQSVLVRAGVAGELPDVAGEFAGVFVNNVAGNKVDYFTSRRLDHRIEVLADGRTRSTITVEFDNEAPRDGYPRHVLGPWTSYTEAGDNLSMVSFVCGLRCEITSMPDAMRDGGTELGRPVADLWLLVEAGAQRRVQYQTITQDGWSVENGELVVPVTHAVQPTINDSHLTVRIDVPDGFTPVDTEQVSPDEDGSLVWSAGASGVVELTFRFARDSEGSGDDG